MAKRKNSSLGCGILNFVLIILVLFSLIADGLYIYYKFFNADKTLGVNYIGEIVAIDTDSLSDKEKAENDAKCFIEANLYSNDKENGTELQELQLTYFTDYTLTSDAIRSTGMQYLGDFETYTTKGLGDNKVLDEFYYYDTTNGITWSGYNGEYGSVATKLNRNTVFVVSINNEPYAIQLDGKVTNGWWIFANTTTYDYGDLFASIMKAIKSNNKGYGDYYITLDLSYFFSVKKYDVESGKFLADDVTDVIKNYCLIKFHYDANGAVKANQSIFGSIECNSAYGLTEEELNTEYWQERIVLSINESNLKTRYSEVAGGYYVGLDVATKNKIANMKRTKLNITININENNKIVGLDYNAFKGIEINKLTILGSGTFVLLDGALINTNIQELQHSNSVVIIKQDNATNNDYLEVVL